MPIRRVAPVWLAASGDTNGGTVKTANTWTATATGAGKIVEVFFVAPASGMVEVRLSLECHITGATTTFPAHAGTSVVIEGPGLGVRGGDQLSCLISANGSSQVGQNTTAAREFVFRGLTPGVRYTARMEHRTNATSTEMWVDSRELSVSPIEPI